MQERQTNSFENLKPSSHQATRGSHLVSNQDLLDELATQMPSSHMGDSQVELAGYHVVTRE